MKNEAITHTGRMVLTPTMTVQIMMKLPRLRKSGKSTGHHIAYIPER